jgi:drug/metabolite transporter (DMT)-like permease
MPVYPGALQVCDLHGTNVPRYIDDHSRDIDMSKNTEGILLALVATALFTVVAALGKLASAEYHVLQILFIRQIIVLLSVLPAVSQNFPQNLKTLYPVLHGLRMAGAFIALAGGLWAVSVLPLTTALVLMFSQTFFVALLAAWFLGEGIGLHRVVSVLGGFLGVIIVMRPGADGFASVMVLVPVAAAAGAAVAVTCVRKLSQTETTATLLSWQGMFVALMSGVPMFWFWRTPNLHDLVLLLGIGLVATLAQWTGIKALRCGEASLVSSMKYTELIYAGLLGYWMFSDVPDGWTLTGAAIIVAAALYMIRREAGARPVQSGLLKAPG